MAFEKFNGKIMLFGEYSVLRGGPALTMPYRNGYGQFKFPVSTVSNSDSWSNNELNRYLEYLGIIKEIDHTKFRHDIKAGLVFSSTLPVGYGVGSSGALVAAVFSYYSTIQEALNVNLQDLRTFLSRMESYFHGSSSGIDPLSCYLGRPLIINKDHITPVSPSRVFQDRFFLLNSGRPGSTGNMVRLFEKKCNGKDFCTMMDGDFLHSNSMAIDGFVNGDKKNLTDGFKMISSLQYNFFEEMIPESVRPIWKSGLESDSYYLKLCGSGGGGFVIGIINNPDEIKTVDFEMMPLKN
ncbi:MAG: hypothetical protein JXB00_13020 [Bacteroidales bacterium]|nr:hypothetical protein [Bacteroidales bacterium]